MMLEPNVEELTNRIDNKYILCNVAAARAKQLVQPAGIETVIEEEQEEHPLTAALKEIGMGVIGYTELDTTISKEDEVTEQVKAEVDAGVDKADDDAIIE